MLSAVGVLGSMAELATLQHWTSVTEFVPWMILIPTGISVGLIFFAPTSASPRFAFITGLVITGVGVVRLNVHTVANVDSAVLDRGFGPTWAQRSVLSQVWAAGTGRVGPARPWP